MSILTDISEALQKGRAKQIKVLVPQALEEGIPAKQILEEGLLAGMSVVGEKFKNNEVFVPEVLVAARAMNVGAELLKPELAEAGVSAKGKVCIGTVKGDLHDIGKNLVRMMFEGKGLEVIDLGVDVAPEAFVQAAMEHGANLIGCSALLTTTMPVMGEVVKAAQETGHIVTVEEHNVIGGLGEAVCALLSERCPTPVRRIGVNDEFGHSGPAADLLRQFGLCADHIVEVALDLCK